MARQELEILVRATDLASPVFDKIARKGSTLADQLRTAGDVSDLNPLKKLGKFVGGAADIAGFGAIGDKADEARTAALGQYAVAVRQTVDAEKAAAAVDRERTAAIAERRGALGELAGEMARINALEKEKLAGSPRGLRGDIRDDADVDREVAAKRYEATIGRAREMTDKADSAEKSHAASLIQKSQATAEYAQRLKQVNAAEEEARRAALRDTRGVRFAAAAGGVLLAVQAVGRLAEAYDKANEKFEKGQLAAGREFVGEFLKGIPIIGSAVSGVETLMQVVTGTATKIREINAEAAKTQAVVAARVGARKDVDAVLAKSDGIGDSEAQKISKDAAAKLAEIAKVRDAAKAVAGLGVDEEEKLAQRERAIVEKRDADLAKIANDAHDKKLATRREHDGELRDAVAEASTAETELVTAQLRAAGRDVDAALAEIRAKFDAQRAKIEEQRLALRDNGELNDSDRIAQQNALGRQRTALDAQQSQEEAATRATAAETTAERVRAINLDAIRLMADAGDKEAERQLKRLEIAERYRQKEAEIATALQNRELSPEARAALEGARGTLAGSRQREMDGMDRGGLEVVQGRGFTAAQDGRFNAMSIGQRAQVEVIRDQARLAKESVEEQKKQTTLLDRLVQQLTGGVIRLNP